MNQLLYDRSIGKLSAEALTRIQTTHLIQSLQHAPGLRFDGGDETKTTIDENGEAGDEDAETLDAARAIQNAGQVLAHASGVNALALERFDNRILISGGADASIKLWDLEDTTALKHVFRPTAVIPRGGVSHTFGITHLSWYPFDAAAFLSSSFDHHLKLWATEDQTLSADFDLGYKVYDHALSPVADHLLVACATQHPAVRLIDLRSGASTQSLIGHHGAVLCVRWSPTVECTLASGSSDGTLRLWDIRKSSAAVGVLNLEDSVGKLESTTSEEALSSMSKAHHGAVNGLTWTDDGSFIISAGHDARVRVWNAQTGANTLASFGPTIRNEHLSTLPLLTSPSLATERGQERLFYPNEREILVFDLHEGRLQKRLRPVGSPARSLAATSTGSGSRNLKHRVTAMVWRGVADGMLTAHTDGQIRAWLPRDADDVRLEREEESERASKDETLKGKDKKRKVLNDIFRNLTRQKISFG